MGIAGLQRKRVIRDVLERRGHVNVAELAGQLRVSEVTVRRYLREMEQEHYLLRTYGGAVRNEAAVTSEFFFGEKAKRQTSQKKAIARAAVALVRNGETIFLDTGTTTLEMARLLVSSGLHLVVATNSLPVAVELASVEPIKLFLLGGFLRRELLDLAGPFSETELKLLAFHQAFLGVDGVSEAGLTTTDAGTARIEEAIIERSRSITVLADSSKIGKTSLLSYGNILNRTIPRRLITDTAASRSVLRKLVAAGFAVTTVSSQEDRRGEKT